MWEVSFEIDELVNAAFVLDIEDWDGPRVFLENVKFWWEFCREALSHVSSFCIILAKSSNELLLLAHFSVLARVHHLKSSSWICLRGWLSFSSFFFDCLNTFTFFHMLEKLTINKSLFTTGAIYFEHVHEILDLDIDIDGPIILVARWASDHSLLTASRTIKHLAI